MIPGINNGRSGITSLQNMENRLTQAGHKLTLPRQILVEWIAAQGASFTATELLESMSRTAPDIGRATVFRTLDLLVELGLLQRVHTEVGKSWGHSYMLCGLVNTHHHHLVCTQCGQVEDVAGCVLDEQLVSNLNAQTSFKVEGHHLELYGQCGQCQQGEGA
jgi:Fur family ferric uptake transcriptional regulator